VDTKVNAHYTLVCQYCDQQARLVAGSVVYPRSPQLWNKSFYFCDNNHEPAWVGCHPRTRQPLGTLADAFTRYWRSQAHAAFDPLWKTRQLTRTQAYAMLAKYLTLEGTQCHIGMFDPKTCKQVTEFVTNWRNNFGKRQEDTQAYSATRADQD
jgi:hypothetical protein